MPEVICPRVPESEPLSPRMRQFVNVVHMVVNSLLRQGILERTGLIDWDVTGDLAIGGDVVGGTPTLVLFIGDDGLLDQDPPFSYDKSNDVLRVPLFSSERDTVPNTSELPTGASSWFIENADP
jgi:hypothetical protein